MKKFLLVLAVLAILFSASSCNKQRKCPCTWKIGNITMEGDVFLGEEGKKCSEYEQQFNYSEIDCHTVY